MRILLLSMPDSFEHTPTLTIRMPNGALASLAGNIDAHHEVAIADLVLVQRAVAETVTRLVDTLRPDLVGLSIMTFQRHTAMGIIRLIRSRRPGVRVVVGGYDPSLDPEPYEDPESGVDFIIRGEGELTLRDLVRALEGGAPLDTIPGLSFRSTEAKASAHESAQANAWPHMRRNPDRAVMRFDVERLALPTRAARVLDGYTFLGRPVDIVETSRGCTYDCSFCSIIEMRGRNFHPFPMDRVIADIADAKARGARTVFIVDDNITLDVERFEELCRAIVDAGLADIDYIVQAMTSSIANHGETLGPLMKSAGFRYVFLGIENILDEDLGFLKAAAKNARRERGKKVGNATIQAIDVLHRHGMFVVGGLIVGNPDDTRESIEANLEFARAYVDWPYIQHPTPYPRTPMTRDFREQDLIVNDDYREYDGTTAVVRSKHLAADEIEFLRWKAERWMKLKHLPPVLAHSPGFVARHGMAMLAHTFRGSSLKSILGLESARDVFARYKAIRRTEREYLPRPSGGPGPSSPFVHPPWRRGNVPSAPLPDRVTG